LDKLFGGHDTRLTRLYTEPYKNRVGKNFCMRMQKRAAHFDAAAG
jgi:hypothetical protein